MKKSSYPKIRKTFVTSSLALILFGTALVGLNKSFADDLMLQSSPYWDEFEYRGSKINLSLDKAQKRTVFNELFAKPAALNVDSADALIESTKSSFDPTFEVSTFRARADDDVNKTRGEADSLTVGVSKVFELGTVLSASQTYTDTDAEFSKIKLDGSGDTTTLSLTQPLLKDGGLLVNTLAREQAKLNLSNEEMQEVDTLATKYNEVTSAYWTHWRSFQNLAIALEQLNMAKRQEELAGKMADAGLVARVEVLRAQTGVAQRYDAIISAQTEIIETNNLLMRLITSDPEKHDLVLIEPDQAGDLISPKLDKDVVLQMALDNSLSLRMLDNNLSSAELGMKAADWQRYPDLDFSASYSVAEDIYKNQTIRRETTNTSDWSVGLTLTIPLWQRSTEADYRQASNTKMQAQYALTGERLNINKTVETAVNRVYQNYRRLLAANNEVNVTQQIYEAEVKQFNRGEQTSTDVLNAASQVATAKSKQALARSEYEKSLSVIDYIIGSTNDVVMDIMELPETAVQ